MNDLEILYEDNHIIAINKPSGAIVQSDDSGDPVITDAIKAYLKEKYNKPGEVFLGVVHRIDRPVSGVVLFARTSKALERLNDMFKNRQIKKTYWAVVCSRPEKESGKLINWLRRSRQKNKSFAYDKEVPESSYCELDYVLKGESDRYFFLEVDPLTGRHHQIRVQLSTMGCSIKGDLKYGAPRSNNAGFIHLHARKIAFEHPVKKEQIEITAPVPNEVLWNVFQENFSH